MTSNAPNVAKSDLKRQLKNFNVRPAIEQAIVKELSPLSASTASRPKTPSVSTSASSSIGHRVAELGTSHSSVTNAERPITPGVPEPQGEPVEPMYVNTNRELDDIFKGMAWDFEGRESEQNWEKREQHMKTLRRLNAGNAPSDFHDAFLGNLRQMLDGIIKCITTLRTSLSKEGCSLVEDIAQTYGPAIEPMVELLMQTLLKMSAGAKKITSQLAYSTVETMINRVAYTPRLMQHLWNACQDKNVQPRQFATGWLKTLLKKVANNKNHIEHTGGVDLLEKCLKKGLADANPTVREKMRSTYWAFWAVWPRRADAIMDDLDATAQKLLMKDPSNPNSPRKADAPRGLSRSTVTASKPSLREAMLGQKRAMASKNLPLRPGSAMSHFSPARTVSNSSNQSTTSTASTVSRATTRTRAEPSISINAGGGMSVAPMRPSRRRPEVARPATAGPYSMRDHPSSLEVDSPDSVQSKPLSPRRKGATPVMSASSATRPRPGHNPRGSESSIPSPTARGTARQRPSPSPRSPLVTAGKPIMPGSPTISRGERVVPRMVNMESSATIVAESEPEYKRTPVSPNIPKIMLDRQPLEQSPPLKIYEDPGIVQHTPKSATPPVLEDKPVNEDVAKLQRANGQVQDEAAPASPDKSRQNSRLLDSGINKIKTMSLEVHGFRKLQSLLRDSQTIISDDRFEALVLGLFAYLADPMEDQSPDKTQDVKAQILTTLKLLLKKERQNFHPHVSKGLEALLFTRASYDSRAHVVSGLELLADELVTLGDASEIVLVLTAQMANVTDASTQGCRTLSMGLHVLKEMLDIKADTYMPSSSELAKLNVLASRCLESADSGVRMDAVKFCVALHARVGEAKFWEGIQGVKDDPKSLITYYIVKRQREHAQ